MSEGIELLFTTWPDEDELLAEMWVADRYLLDVRHRPEGLMVSLGLATGEPVTVSLDELIDGLKAARSHLAGEPPSASTPVSDLLRLDPTDLLGRLDSVELPDSSHWDLLRQSAGNRAIASTGREEKLAWATVAVHASGRMVVDDEFDRTLAATRVAMVRARLISQLGAEVGHPILDVDELLTWFVGEVGSLDVGREWPVPGTPIEEVRVGRRIKNYLGALAPLLEDPRFADRTAMAVVRQWWDRRDALP